LVLCEASASDEFEGLPFQRLVRIPGDSRALAILEIGLARIRAECPHFKGWLTRLEARAQLQ
jgi:hypothetical protein